jgi:uncharacterized coiled-coil DUF342 family protein
MSKKTVKELDAEFILLKKEHQELNSKFDSLSEKYRNLEKMYDECMSKKKTKVKCNNCDENFENKKELIRHQKTHMSRNGSFKCDDCDKSFDEGGGLG